MAKVTVTVAVFLLLVAVAQARFPFDLGKKTVNEEPKTVLPESDSKATATNVLLPTRKPETETEIEAELDTIGIIGWDLEIAEEKLTESETSDGDSSAGSDSVTVISFLPPNRHFKRRLPFPFSRGHHCHHLHQYEHGHLLRREEGVRFRGRDAGYGNGMILSEEGVNVETVIRDRPRLVPGRWMRFRNGDDMRMHHHQKHEEMHHEHDQEKHEHEQQNHENDNEHGHDQANVFLRKIRKFLTNF